MKYLPEKKAFLQLIFNVSGVEKRIIEKIKTISLCVCHKKLHCFITIAVAHLSRPNIPRRLYHTHSLILYRYYPLPYRYEKSTPWKGGLFLTGIPK